jgi:hypothetical protein
MKPWQTPLNKAPTKGKKGIKKKDSSSKDKT